MPQGPGQGFSTLPDPSLPLLRNHRASSLLGSDANLQLHTQPGTSCSEERVWVSHLQPAAIPSTVRLPKLPAAASQGAEHPSNDVAALAAGAQPARGCPPGSAGRGSALSQGERIKRSLAAIRGLNVASANLSHAADRKSYSNYLIAIMCLGMRPHCGCGLWQRTTIP